tara:strand:- start:4784 stop:5119 length:336 start_codon:yes stop_codon:yes gene_type:complete
MKKIIIVLTLLSALSAFGADMRISEFNGKYITENSGDIQLILLETSYVDLLNSNCLADYMKSRGDDFVILQPYSVGVEIVTENERKLAIITILSTDGFTARGTTVRCPMKN